MAMNEELAQSIREHSQLSEEQLLAELGGYVEEWEQDPIKTATRLAVPAPPPPDTSQLAGPFAEKLKAIGIRFLRRFNRNLHDLMCNPNDPDNAKVKEAILSGGEAAGYVLGGVLLAHFVWLPGIVAIVAALLLKRFAQCAYDEACQLWADELK